MTTQQGQLIGVLRLCLAAALILAIQVLGFAQSQNSAARPDRGVRPNGTYSISDIENINLSNGNVNLSIPLAQLPPVAGGKLSWTVRAIYNSKTWDVKREEVMTEGIPAGRYVKDVIQQANNGGWRIGGPYQILFQTLTAFDFGWLGPEIQDPDYAFFVQYPYWDWVKVQLVTPDGATHELRPVGYTPFQQSERDFLWGYYWQTPDKVGAPMTYYSSDGSYIWARLYPLGNALRWEAYLPDGTRVFVKNGFQRVEDPNGNTIKIVTEPDPVTGNLTTYYRDENAAGPVREIRQFYNPQTNTQQIGGSFGGRLAELRKAAGYSQRDLAAEIGISQRMVAYYETQSDYPPTHLFPALAKALGVSADQLLGIEKLKQSGRARDNRLWRRFSQVEKLPSPQRKQIVQTLDAATNSCRSAT